MQSIKQTCATFLIVAFLAPGLFLGIAPPKQAEAAGEGLIGDIIGAGVSYALCEYGDDIGDFLDDMLGGALGSIFGTDQSEDPDSTESLEYSVPVSESNKQIKQDTGKTRSGVESDLYKECVLDPVAWVIKSLLINEVEDDILEWVNTGFEDGPIFVRDPVDFAKSLARDSFDVYLDDSEVDDYVCPQFIDDDIMQRFEDLSTQSAYGDSGSARCTVDTNDYYTMVTNGSVEGVGIIEAMSLVQEGNNPYSSFFNLQADAAKRTGEVTAREMTILEYGDGYHSPRCEQNDKEGVCTPGQLVSKQIDDWLGGALGQLENADEVSEIISDLIAKLVSSIFSNEDDGLLGDYDLEGDDADPLSGDGYTNPLDPGGDGGPTGEIFHHYNPTSYAGEGPPQGVNVHLCWDAPHMTGCTINGNPMPIEQNDPDHSNHDRQFFFLPGASGYGGTIVCTADDGEQYTWEVPGGTEMVHGGCWGT